MPAGDRSLDGRRRNRAGEPEWSKHETKTKDDVIWDEGHVPRERTKLTSSTTQLEGVAVILPVNVVAADACFFGRAGCQLRAGGPVPMTGVFGRPGRCEGVTRWGCAAGAPFWP